MHKLFIILLLGNFKSLMMSRLREIKYNTHNPFRQNACDNAAG